MKQGQLVKDMYKACFEHNASKEKELFVEELRKVFARKQKGKPFTAKWVVVR